MSKEPESEPETPPHNEMVQVTVLCRLDFDGDPDTEGTEAYDIAGNEAGLPHSFACPRITAEGLAKAGIVEIVGPD